MKNNLLALLLILPFCLASCASTESIAVKASSKEKDSDGKSLQIRGSVKRMEVIPSEGAPGLKDVYSFNEDGNITEQSTVYRSDNRVYTKTVNSYDGSGRKISSESFKDDKLEKKSTFKNDDRGNPAEQLDYDAAGELTSKTANKYDGEGNLLEKVVGLVKPVSGGMPGLGLAEGSFKTVYDYDENGNLTEIKTFFPPGKTAFGNQRFAYNRLNQKIEETEISPTYENKLPRVNRRFYSYNEQGDVAEIKNYEPVKESNTESVKDRFKIIDAKGTVQNGSLISDKPYMILWDATRCEYEYDARGNWTKQICKWKVRDTKDFVSTTDQAPQRFITYF